MKFKILVIDDNWDIRKSDYQQVLSDEDFDLIGVENGSEWEKMIETEQVDGYLVDIVLSGWNNLETGEPPELLDVLKKIGKVKPALLVSSEYEKLVAENNKLKYYINDIIQEGYNVPALYTWQEFENERLYKDDQRKIKRIKQSVIIALGKFRQEESKNCDVAIICALQNPEFKWVKDIFGLENYFFRSVKYFRGTIETKHYGKRVIIAAIQSKMGMVDCTALSIKLITEFKPKYLIMPGICGGIADKALGDIVIPNEIFTYQTGNYTDNGFENKPKFIEINEKITQMLSHDVVTELQKKVVASPFYQGKKKKAPELIMEAIACGDAVVNKTDMLKRDIKQVRYPSEYRKKDLKARVPAVDMESYAILRACRILDDEYHTIPIVIKAISDYAENKDARHERDLAASNSAICTKVLIENYLDFDNKS